MEKVKINGGLKFLDELNKIDTKNIVSLSKKYNINCSFGENSIVFPQSISITRLKKIHDFIHSLVYYMFYYDSIRHIHNKKSCQENTSMKGVIEYKVNEYKSVHICVINNWYINISIYKIDSKIGGEWIDCDNKTVDRKLNIMTNIEPGILVNKIIAYKEKDISVLNKHIDKTIDTVKEIPRIVKI